MHEPTQNDVSGHIRQDEIDRLKCALWVYENNPPHPIIDAILTDAYEALRRAKGE